MKVSIADECINCGLCSENCPEVFEDGDGTAVVRLDQVPADLEDKVRKAAEQCPVEAIIVED